MGVASHGRDDVRVRHSCADRGGPPGYGRCRRAGGPASRPAAWQSLRWMHLIVSALLIAGPPWPAAWPGGLRRHRRPQPGMRHHCGHGHGRSLMTGPWTWTPPVAPG